jgi:hypothetical protein
MVGSFKVVDSYKSTPCADHAKNPEESTQILTIQRFTAPPRIEGGFSHEEKTQHLIWQFLANPDTSCSYVNETHLRAMWLLGNIP